MAFAKIVDGVDIVWKNATVHKTIRKLFFHFPEIDLLMQQPGADAITIKNAIIGGESYTVMVAVTGKGLQGYDVPLVEPGNYIALSCPKFVIPGYSVEVDIREIPKIVELNKPNLVIKTRTVLDQQI